MWQPTPAAIAAGLSIVIHDTPAAATGSGAKFMCADLVVPPPGQAPTTTTEDPHAVCGSEFSCYASLGTAGGTGAFALHPLGKNPAENEPHVDIDGLGHATVFIRGAGGGVGAVATSAALRTDPDDLVTNIWLVDQDGDVVCHTAFSASTPAPRTGVAYECDLPSDVVTVQAHVFCQRSGLYAGVVLNKEQQRYAALRRGSATASASLGQDAFHTASANLAEAIRNFDAGFSSVSVPDFGLATPTVAPSTPPPTPACEDASAACPILVTEGCVNLNTKFLCRASCDNCPSASPTEAPTSASPPDLDGLPDTTLLAVLQGTLATHNTWATDRGYTVLLLTSSHLGSGIAAMLRARTADTSACDTVNIAVLAGSGGGSAAPDAPCSVSSVVDFCVAFATGAGADISDATAIAALRSAFTASIGPALACEVATPAGLLCYNAARQLFFTTAGTHGEAFHSYFSLAVNALHYIDLLTTGFGFGAGSGMSMVEHQPYIQINHTAGSFWCGVLGAGGSTTNLSTDVTVEAVWVEDQRGTVVYFYDLASQASGAPLRFDYNLTAHGPKPTALVPFQYSRDHGLWRGFDAISFDHFYSSTTLGLVSSTGSYVQGGRYKPGHSPKEWDVYMSVSSDRMVRVRTRGAWGSIALFPASSSSLYISHFWVTDQDGRTVCTYGFDAPGDPVFSCELPSTAITVTAHQYGVGCGFWSGASLNVEHEVYASGRIETCSANGTGAAYYHAGSTSLVAHDPYVTMDWAAGAFSCTVLGAGCSSSCALSFNPQHYVDRMWFKNQHGAIFYSEDLSAMRGVVSASYSLASSSTPVSSATPYYFDNLLGLWMGLDPMGFAYLYSVNTLDLLTADGAFAWNGRYVAGAENLAVARMWEPHLTFSSDLSSVSVVVRGADGSTAAFPEMSASNYVAHIWVTDQNDVVLCETALPPPKVAGSPCARFDAGSVCKDDLFRAPTLNDCPVPATATSVRAHQFCTGHGLWSSRAWATDGSGDGSVAGSGEGPGISVVVIIGIVIISVLVICCFCCYVKKRGAAAKGPPPSATSSTIDNPMYLPASSWADDGYLDVEANRK
jgi:hypothetical protein